MRARSLLKLTLVLGLLGAAGWVFRDRLPLDRVRALLGQEEPEAPPKKAKSASKKRSSSGASLRGAAGLSPEPGRLSMPSPKPCLDPPTGEGLPEEGMTSSRGLEAGEVRSAMSAVVSYALPCFADAPSGALVLSVTAGCDGRVSDIRVDDDGGYPTDVVGCVVETLRNAEFPAHDLPDGYTFTYPVRYEAP